MISLFGAGGSNGTANRTGCPPGSVIVGYAGIQTCAGLDLIQARIRSHCFIHQNRRRLSDLPYYYCSTKLTLFLLLKPGHGQPFDLRSKRWPRNVSCEDALWKACETSPRSLQASKEEGRSSAVLQHIF